MDWDVVLFSRDRNSPGRGTVSPGQGVRSHPTPPGVGAAPGVWLPPGRCWCSGSSRSTAAHGRGQRLPSKEIQGPALGQWGCVCTVCAHTRTLCRARARIRVCTRRPACTARAPGNRAAPGPPSRWLLLQVSASPSWRVAITVTPRSVRRRQWVLPTNAVCRCRWVHARPRGSPCVPRGTVRRGVCGRAHGGICLTGAGQRDPTLPMSLPGFLG